MFARATRTDDRCQRLLALGAELFGYTAKEAARGLLDDVALRAVVVTASGAAVK